MNRPDGHEVGLRLVPASALNLSALVELFNTGFSEYPVPMQMDEDGLREHLDNNSIDLVCSRIAMRPSEGARAFALIALRGDAGWLGGMGTVPSARKLGLGERVLRAGIEAARARGARAIWLEVLEGNLPAVGLYRKLGFERVRDLLVWSLPPTGIDAPAGRAVEPDVAHAWIVRHRRSREPWQRDDAVLASVRLRNVPVSGRVIERGGEVRAGALVTEAGDTVRGLQVAALDAEAARAVLLAAAGAQRSLRFTNLPEDDPASSAMCELGARVVARQHEMRLRL